MTPNLAETTVHALRELAGQAPGAFAEPKGSGLAIHYRLAPEAELLIAGALKEFHDQHNGQFKIWPGQKVFEVIPAGFSKGTALATFAALPPFKDRIPIMIGDDVGDEPAFAEAERLNGYGLRVAGENFPQGRADFDGPRSVLTWLDQLGRRLG
jgi:trehalose 6-phosphate phosphatase